MLPSREEPGLPRLAIDRRMFVHGAAAFALMSTSGSGSAQAATPAVRDPLTVVIDDLVAAGRILSNEGTIDAFGHVSARHPTRQDHFLMSRARAPALIETTDIMEFDRDGAPVDAQGRRPYLERFIHAAIYQARADVRSVIHDHSREVVPFSVSATTKLRPMGHTGGVIGAEVPVWDIRESFGNATNMLVSNLAMGRDVAARLGAGSTLLMRGHGAVIAAKTVRLATFTAINLDIQARLQREAMSLGETIPLSAGEVAGTAALFDPSASTDSVGRAWEYWCVRANVPFHPA